MKAIFLPIMLCITMVSAHAQDWEHLFQRAKYQDVKISPDGKHLAVAMDSDGKRALIFISRSTMKMVGASKLPGKNEVGTYHWANNERVVFKIFQREPWQEELSYYGELFAVNIDGSSSELIYGYRNVDNTLGTRTKKKKQIKGWANIVDMLPDDEKNILISSTPWGSNFAGLYKLNIYNGRSKKQVIGTPVANAKFVTNAQGEAKLVKGVNKQNEIEVHIRKDDEWQELASEKFGNNFYPLTFDESGENLFVVDNFQQDKTGLFKLNLSNGKMTAIFTPGDVDVSQVKITSDEKNVYAVASENGFPTYHLINNELKEAQVFKQLVASFPDQRIDITSRTEKGDVYIVRVSSDIEAGQFYIFDLANNKLSGLFKFHPNISPQQLAYTDPIEFMSSDGFKIRGYFTQAKTKSADIIAPLVVLVHGGPHSKDDWEYSSEVQYLALNGYSVLQVNFRGSTGYGAKFYNAGFKHWGDTIQQDIYEAYQWAISAGIANKDNACIMGGSFGAYSALQSAIKYPNTYRCAIGYAGVYDLALMFDEGNIKKLYRGKAYLEDTLGTDAAVHSQMSPVHNVSRIEIPIFIAHGEQDEQVPFEHSVRLKSALDEARKPYTWHKFSRESHGFFDPENHAEYMKSVVSFLDKNI